MAASSFFAARWIEGCFAGPARSNWASFESRAASPAPPPPISSSALTTLPCPRSHAACNAVLPNLSRRAGSAPAAMSRRTTAGWPAAAATCGADRVVFASMAVRASDGQAATCALTWLIAAAPSPVGSSSTRRPFAQALSPASAGSAGRGVDGVESVYRRRRGGGRGAAPLVILLLSRRPRARSGAVLVPASSSSCGAAERAALCNLWLWQRCNEFAALGQLSLHEPERSGAV